MYERKAELKNSWEYSSLHLSPDMTETADITFKDLEKILCSARQVSEGGSVA